ncbi:ATP-binding protein [Leptothoe kymatousa]|uniref:histidine kinase n=1 Tax=Leptothoe kymatousa TAU-MAC 1615 TaxID=2364775 RepID=A0ABS5Y4F8_9CYAN|nr:ATP-binding protein [Leptothoe kymatousa]MBT9312729.1 PAS domain S-box protein [Leptothoe kymatousa TAU-MAC 1615]
MVSSEQQHANLPLTLPPLGMFFEIAPSLLCVLDAGGYFHTTNPEFSSRLGYVLPALQSHRFLDFVHPEDCEATFDVLSQLGESAVTLENRYRSATGSYCELRWQLTKKAGWIYGAALEVVAVEKPDAEPAEQAAQALDTCQPVLASIFDMAGEAIICIDQDQQIQLFNRRAENIFGYGAQDIVGQPLGRLLPEPSSLTNWRQRDTFGTSGARPVAEGTSTVTGRRKNGETFPAVVSVAKNSMDGGLWYTIVLQDLTGQMAAAASIRRSEERLRTTTNALPVLIAYIDAQEYYRFNNRAYENWLGVPYQSLEGQRLSQALGPDIYAIIQPYLHQALKGERVTFEVELPKSDRAYRWVSISYQPDIQKGKVKGCFALTQDISAHKAADQLKDEFVSVVSHELRTPLTSIHGSLKLLTTGKLGHLAPQGQELLEIALNNTERLTRLINDVLDLERIESGLIKMIKVRCRVADLLEQAAHAMGSMAQAHGVTVNIVPVEADIYADPDHIEQTLTNLLSNAIKFSLQGQTVLLEAVDQPHQILFKVIDHGRGIPEDKLETIFERFQQVDASDTRKHGGTGLGLAICREIVQHHHGRIWVKSIHGQGSTFCFTLPKSSREDPSP